MSFKFSDLVLILSLLFVMTSVKAAEVSYQLGKKNISMDGSSYNFDQGESLSFGDSKLEEAIRFNSYEFTANRELSKNKASFDTFSFIVVKLLH